VPRNLANHVKSAAKASIRAYPGGSLFCWIQRTDTVTINQSIVMDRSIGRHFVISARLCVLLLQVVDVQPPHNSYAPTIRLYGVSA
jgi:hypothetical protein